MTTWVVNAFFIRINPWKFGEKKIKILLKVTTPKEFQQALNNFVNFEMFSAKLSGIDPYEKHID